MHSEKELRFELELVRKFKLLLRGRFFLCDLLKPITFPQKPPGILESRTSRGLTARIVSAVTI
jgi:hypothetical protein